MKRFPLISLVFILIISCNDGGYEDLSTENPNDSNTNTLKKINNSSNLNSFGTIDPATGEFIEINNPSALDPQYYPYVDLNVAFYDNSFLLQNCPQNGKECVDLAHFIAQYILPLRGDTNRIPIFYGPDNYDFFLYPGSNTGERIFKEVGSQSILVTKNWMTNTSANYVLDLFRNEIKNNFLNNHLQIVALNIYTVEYFGPSRYVYVKIKTK